MVHRSRSSCHPPCPLPVVWCHPPIHLQPHCSTHHPPHEQSLTRLAAGGVPFVVGGVHLLVCHSLLWVVMVGLAIVIVALCTSLPPYEQWLIAEGSGAMGPWCIMWAVVAWSRGWGGQSVTWHGGRYQEALNREVSHSMGLLASLPVLLTLLNGLTSIFDREEGGC
jgi:hypothetical protein